ncbi:hypothetical protein [Pseudoalteromonas spongiae]|uniref:hypothetical protein n=1 Tax=Pseudoalteromonas spongiae TaxID=298657 RepID=UPI00026C9A46|nr:hypothetical protein [Pseudoalteromonas spongiae]ATC99575.1 hypothetical protein PSPO_a2664 [Pseudoalteromonas spongiae UST010723-006]
MNGESSFEPNFVLVDEEKAIDPSESDVCEQANTLSVDSENGLPITSNELEYIKKKRKQLRLFDPAGVYDFRHVEISYLHSFWHVLSICCSLIIFYGLSILNISETKVVITGLGEVSDLSVLDIIGLTFVTVYPLIKLKQVLSSKVSEFNKRYQLALFANAFNLINLNYLKLLILFFAIDLAVLIIDYSEIRVDSAIEKLYDGVLYDTFLIIHWFILSIVFIRAFKYCGKGKEEIQ